MNIVKMAHAMKRLLHKLSSLSSTDKILKEWGELNLPKIVRNLTASLSYSPNIKDIEITFKYVAEHYSLVINYKVNDIYEFESYTIGYSLFSQIDRTTPSFYVLDGSWIDEDKLIFKKVLEEGIAKKSISVKSFVDSIQNKILSSLKEKINNYN